MRSLELVSIPKRVIPMLKSLRSLKHVCHFGKTPPCAMSFLQAGVNRVVVGFRDPNPRVDGGGVTMMAREGIPVDLMMKDASEAESDEEAENAQACADIVSAFANRRDHYYQ
mmetsp:Transcript_17460/g.25464  ORF Transcript_17460/g.25464 Transcript_17460/m.25464 type:complete len:112 (-) Transcript_17460:335-670(-)